MPPISDVDAWFAARQHPQSEVMQALGAAIMAADPRMSETVKWQSPTFTYKGNLASINPQAKAYVSLMFHRGAEIPGLHPELQGGGDVARYMRFNSMANLAAKRAALEAVVRAWCDARDAGP